MLTMNLGNKHMHVRCAILSIFLFETVYNQKLGVG